MNDSGIHPDVDEAQDAAFAGGSIGDGCGGVDNGSRIFTGVGYVFVLPDGSTSLCAPVKNVRVADQRRKGDWIQTFTGGMFWPLDPRADEFGIVDIAGGLSKECRYAGQCLRFYTVAEHSVWMTRAARGRGYSIRDQRAVLLHDSSEGLGLRDIPRPIKGDLTNYRDIENDIMAVVAQKFDFDWPLPSHLKMLDEQIGLAEEAQNMAPKPAEWRTHPQHADFEASWPLAVKLEYWLPDRAFTEFMIEFIAVGGRL